VVHRALTLLVAAASTRRLASGGGAFVIWDRTSILRIDVAYSPDASAVNPGFPFGVYVQDGFVY
jgi:hypothetical protein